MKNLKYALSARWLALLGIYAQNAVLPILIFNMTNSASILSAIYISETLPWIFISPILIPILNRFINDKLVICLNPLFRAIILTFMIVYINNFYVVVFAFFILGILNAMNASYSMKLMKLLIPEEKVDNFIGVILGVDDIISVIAPFIATFMLARDFEPILFIKFHVLTLIINSLLLSFIKIPSVSNNKSSAMEKFEQTKQSILSVFKYSKVKFLVLIEFLRSVAEGIFIPLLIIYFKLIIVGSDEFFTFGGTLMCLFQVIFSFTYFLISKHIDKNKIIVMATLIICLALAIIINTKQILFYLLTCALLGMGMSLRQLVAENLLISLPKDEVTMITTNYNAIIALGYLIGYFISITQAKYPVIIYFKLSLALSIISLLITIPRLCETWEDKSP